MFGEYYTLLCYNVSLLGAVMTAIAQHALLLWLAVEPGSSGCLVMLQAALATCVAISNHLT